MQTTVTSCFASVIVPVYNAEHWLRECIDSILAQSDPDFELLLIDDGSTDQSGRILDDYAKEHPLQIRVIHQRNQGVSNARNTALEMARGEFLLFADADDVVHPQLIELLKAANRTQTADFYCWHYQQFTQTIQFPTITQPALEPSSTDMLLPRIFESDGNILGYIWNKAFRRSAVRGIYFDEDIRVQEDLLFVSRCLAGKHLACCVLPLPLYGYRQVSNSASRRPFSASQLTILPARDRIIQLLKNGSEVEKQQALRLSQGFPLYICVTNKKLLHTRVNHRKEAFRMVDTLWAAYASYAELSSWPLKEKCYFLLQRLCYRFRRIFCKS